MTSTGKSFIIFWEKSSYVSSEKKINSKSIVLAIKKDFDLPFHISINEFDWLFIASSNIKNSFPEKLS
jgi:hypothetical protein